MCPLVAPLKMGVVLSNREEELFASCWGEDEHGEEGSWCRTMVEGPTSSESMVMVHYPDYGNSGELEITELRKLPTEFYKLPFQVGAKKSLGWCNFCILWSCYHRRRNFCGRQIFVGCLTHES